MPDVTVRIGETDIRVVDPDAIVPVIGEVITEMRIIDGILYLSLASHIFDGSGPPEARIVARLRLPMATVFNIRQGIDNILSDIEQAKKAAN